MYVYQGEEKADAIIHLSYSYPYGLPETHEIVDQSVKINKISYDQAVPANWAPDPSTFTLDWGTDEASAAFSFSLMDEDLLILNGYTIMRVEAEATLLIENTETDEQYEETFSQVFGLCLSVWKKRWNRVTVDEYYQRLSVLVSEVILLPAPTAWQLVNPSYLAVVGEEVAVSSEGKKISFCPNNTELQQYNDQSGIARFDYAGEPELFGVETSSPKFSLARESETGSDSAIVQLEGNRALPPQKITVPFAIVTSTFGKAYVKQALSTEYEFLNVNTKVYPGSIIRLDSWYSNGVMLNSSVSLKFFDQTGAQVDYSFNSDAGSVYVKLGEEGIEGTGNHNFMVDVSNVKLELLQNSRLYLQMTVWGALYLGLRTYTWPWGFIQSSVATSTGMYLIKKVSQDISSFFGSEKSENLPYSGRLSMDSAVENPLPDTLAFQTFLATDGAVEIKNIGTPLLVSNPTGQQIVPDSSIVSFDPETGTAGVPLPFTPPEDFDVPISITPADGSTVDSLLTCVNVEYPAAQDEPIVPSSVRFRVNGVLASEETDLGLTLSGYLRPGVTGSRWCPFRGRPLNRGENLVKASLITLKGKKSKCTARFQAQPGVPQTPSSISAYAGVNSVILIWQESSEPQIAGYRVYRSASAGQQGTLLNSQPLTQPSYVDSSLPAATTAYYGVTAVDSEGRESVLSRQSNARLGTGLTRPVPQDVTNFVVSSGARLVKISFTNTGGSALLWRLERAGTSGGPFSSLFPVGEYLSTTYYEDRTTQLGRTYWYRLTPLGYDLKAGKPVVSGPVSPADPPPSPPAGLTAEESGTQVLVEWNPSLEEGVVGYHVYRAKLYGDYQRRTSNLSTTAWFKDNVDSRDTYSWKVTAVDSQGRQSDYSQPVLFSTYGIVPELSECPECANSPVNLTNIQFGSDRSCTCSDATSITLGEGVTVEAGATVIFKAPKVTVKSGVVFKSGANVTIKRE